MTVTVMHGDVLEQLHLCKPRSHDCIVTSPPYWALRDYGIEGQLGLEADPKDYLAKMVEIFRACKIVLKKRGTMWVNMGDSYVTGTVSKSSAGAIVHEKHSQARAAVPRNGNPFGLRVKNMIGMPWRLALALQDDGWILRQEIIWEKPNPMPESARDRCTKAHEHLFLFVQAEFYYFNADAIKEPVSEGTHARLSQDLQNQIGSSRANGGRKTNGNMKAVGSGVGFGHGTDKDARDRSRVKHPTGWQSGSDRGSAIVGRYEYRKVEEHGGQVKNNESFDSAMAIMPTHRNKRTIWKIPTYSFKEAHFATFPPELPEICIKAGCPPGGKVLDIFGGAFTTALVAERLQLDSTMIEINPAYIAIGKRRLLSDAPPMFQPEIIDFIPKRRKKTNADTARTQPISTQIHQGIGTGEATPAAPEEEADFEGAGALANLSG